MTDQKKNRPEPIIRTALQLQQHAFTIHACTVPAKVTPDQLTDTKLWEHVVAKLNELDEIRVIPEDKSYYARLLVTFADGSNVRVKVIEFVEVDVNEANPDIDPEYDIKQMGTDKWCIIQKSSGNKVQKGIPNQQAALKALSDYLKALKR